MNSRQFRKHAKQTVGAIKNDPRPMCGYDDGTGFPCMNPATQTGMCRHHTIVALRQFKSMLSRQLTELRRKIRNTAVGALKAFRRAFSNLGKHAVSLGSGSGDPSRRRTALARAGPGVIGSV